MNTMSEKWNQYSSLIPIITAMAIGLGYIHMYQFYNKAGIEVFSYITTSEILLAFVPHLPFIIIIATATTVSLVFSQAFEKFADIKIKSISNKYIKIIAHILTLVIIGGIMFFYTFLPRMGGTTIQLISGICLLVLIGIVLIAFKDIKSNFRILRIDYFIVASYLLSITYFNANSLGNRTISGESIDFSLTTTDEIYDNNEYIYYGRLRDYSFLIKSNDTTTIIIKNSAIVKEEFKVH